MTDAAHDAKDGHGASPRVGHVVELHKLLGVLLALVALTLLTVWTGKMDLHGFDLGIAMIIATVKATLVCLIFMHLFWDRRFHGMMFVTSVAFVGLFLAFTGLDAAEYQEDIKDRAREDPALRQAAEAGAAQADEAAAGGQEGGGGQEDGDH